MTVHSADEGSLRSRPHAGSPQDHRAQLSTSPPPAERTGQEIRPAARGRPLSRQERLTIISGILCVVLVLVVIQLWLLTATMNAYLGGDTRIVWPAAAASFGCFGLNLGLLWYLYRLER